MNRKKYLKNRLINRNKRGSVFLNRGSVFLNLGLWNQLLRATFQTMFLTHQKMENQVGGGIFLLLAIAFLLQRFWGPLFLCSGNQKVCSYIYSQLAHLIVLSSVSGIVNQNRCSRMFAFSTTSRFFQYHSSFFQYHVLFKYHKFTVCLI